MSEEDRRPGRNASDHPDRPDRPGHPNLAELDALRTGEAGAEVRSHLEGCERCRRVAGELGALAGEIGAALRVPEVDIPADVDGRLRAMARARAAAVRAADGDTLQAATGDLASSRRTPGEGQPTCDTRKVSPSAADGNRTRSRRTIYFSWPGLVAAAATVLIAVGVTMSVRRREASMDVSRLADAEAGPMDIDRDGTVDIVDAYLMSRRLGSRAEAPPSWDFDRDGAVGEADVKAVAMQAVALADGGI